MRKAFSICTALLVVAMHASAGTDSDLKKLGAIVGMACAVSNGCVQESVMAISKEEGPFASAPFIGTDKQREGAMAAAIGGISDARLCSFVNSDVRVIRRLDGIQLFANCRNNPSYGNATCIGYKGNLACSLNRSGSQ